MNDPFLSGNYHPSAQRPLLIGEETGKVDHPGDVKLFLGSSSALTVSYPKIAGCCRVKLWSFAEALKHLSFKPF